MDTESTVRDRSPSSTMAGRKPAPAPDTLPRSDSGERPGGPLAEFVALREEILDRVRAQQQLFALQLTATATLFGFVVSQGEIASVMLIVPFSSYLLCGRLVACHFGTVRVAEYIRDHLSHQVSGGLSWGSWLRGQSTKPHLLGSLLPLMLTFAGPSVLALLATIGFVFGRTEAGLGTRVGFIALWCVGLMATALSTMLVLQMTGRARVRSWMETGLF